MNDLVKNIHRKQKREFIDNNYNVSKRLPSRCHFYLMEVNKHNQESGYYLTFKK